MRIEWELVSSRAGNDIVWNTIRKTLRIHASFEVGDGYYHVLWISFVFDDLMVY